MHTIAKQNAPSQGVLCTHVRKDNLLFVFKDNLFRRSFVFPRVDKNRKRIALPFDRLLPYAKEIGQGVGVGILRLDVQCSRRVVRMEREVARFRRPDIRGHFFERTVHDYLERCVLVLFEHYCGVEARHGPHGYLFLRYAVHIEAEKHDGKENQEVYPVAGFHGFQYTKT